MSSAQGEVRFFGQLPGLIFTYTEETDDVKNGTGSNTRVIRAFERSVAQSVPQLADWGVNY